MFSVWLPGNSILYMGGGLVRPLNYPGHCEPKRTFRFLILGVNIIIKKKGERAAGSIIRVIEMRVNKTSTTMASGGIFLVEFSSCHDMCSFQGGWGSTSYHFASLRTTIRSINRG